MKENTFDKHFEKPDSLEELLDDDLIITEFKNQNPKLMEFVKAQEFKKLIDYIIVVPSSDQDSKRAFRYPFYACELLCCDNVKVMDMFFPKDDESVDEATELEPKETIEQNSAEDKERLAKRQTSIGPDQTFKDEENKEDKENKEEENKEDKENKKDKENKENKSNDLMERPTLIEEQKSSVLEEVKVKVETKEIQLQEVEINKFDIFNHFCSFITELKDEVNEVLAGYFCKVFSSLFQRKQDEIISSIYNQTDLTFLNQLVSHIDSRSLAEVVLKLIAFEKSNLDENYLKQKLIIIGSLVDFFKQNGFKNFEIGANIQMIVQELCQKAYAIQNGKEILQYLINPDIFGIFVELQTNENIYLSLPSSNIVHSLLIFSLNDDLKSNDDDDGDSLQIEYLESLTLLANSYPMMLAFLKKEPANQKIKFQLGQTKLKLVEIIQMILRIKYDEPKFLLAEQNLFGVLNPLLQQNPFNNLYHLQYHKIVTTIIEQDNRELIINIFETNQLMNFLFTLTEGTKSLRSEDKKVFRKGYLGFIIKLGKFLEDFSEKNTELKTRLQSEEWESFKTQFFNRALQDNEKDLGGLSNNRERGSSEIQIDFNRQDIESRYVGFLTNNPSSPPLNQETDPFSEPNLIAQDEIVDKEKEKINNIFDAFGGQSLQQGNSNGASFESFGWVQPTNLANTQQVVVGWDVVQKQIDISEDVQELQYIYWKIKETNDVFIKKILKFENKTLDEFDANQ